MSITFESPHAQDPNMVMAVDSEGHYLGWVPRQDHRVEVVVDQSPPNADPWVWDATANSWLRAWYVDDQGNQVNNRSDATNAVTQMPPSSDHVWSSDQQRWVDPLPVKARLRSYRQNAVAMADTVLRNECITEQAYYQEVVDLRNMLSAYWQGRNKPKAAKLNQYLALLLEELSDPNITAEDARAAYIQFTVNTRDLIL